MKILSRSLLALLLLTSALPSVQAAVTMVSGNIYDVGKLTYSQDEWLDFDGTYIGNVDDSPMCWAAAAANVIQYWQDEYKQHADAGKTAPNGFNPYAYEKPVGTDYLNVYQEILNKWKPGSGLSMNAIGWWMQGLWLTGQSSGFIYYPSNSRLKNEADLNTGGFYTNVFGDHRQLLVSGKGGLPIYPSLTNASFYSAQVDFSGAEETAPYRNFLEQSLKNAFKTAGQSVALSLISPSGTGHAITCWGYETDADGKITSLILSDSDDRRYGTFMAELVDNGDQTASIHTDRYASWYYGKYRVLDATYIATPDTTLDGSKTVAHSSSDVPTITSISGAVTSSCTLTQSVMTDQSVVIGGGTYEGTDTLSAIVFRADAALSVYDVTDAPALKIEDGAMALLNGGLEVENNSNGGVVTDSHLYIHGGDVSIKGNRADHSGAGIYATAFNGKGVYAGTYVEMMRAGKIAISDNTATISADVSLGGGMAAEDSFSVSKSGAVTVARNKLVAKHGFGGGAGAVFQAKLSENKSVTFTDNAVEAKGNVAEGGALSGMFVNLNGNGALEFNGNAVRVNNKTSYYYQPGEVEYYVFGAHANGGAVALSYVQPIMSNTDYLGGKLNIDDNGAVSFIGNTVRADYSYNDYGEGFGAYADGGALYIGSFRGVGAQASVSRNKGDVVFSGNQAAAAAADGMENAARGGAVYVAENSVLDIKDNKADLAFENNSVIADTAQGGAIYNAAGAKLSLSNNAGNVRFSGNSAKEGNDLYNAAGAVAELAWNGNLHVDNTGHGDTASIVNKGTLYMAAEAGHTMDFVNASIDSSEGRLVLGKDAAGSRTGSGALRFTDGAKTMSLAATENLSATLDKVTLSLGTITGGGTDATMMNHIAVAANTNVHISDLRMGADTSVSVGSNSITLSNVVIDLSEADYSIISAGTGTLYRFNLQDMINCELTLDRVTFDATGVKGFSFGNNVGAAMDFGSDVTFTGPAEVMLLSAGTEPTLVTMMPGMVIFGDVVPEPSTDTLTLSALAALCARRRRKR